MSTTDVRNTSSSKDTSEKAEDISLSFKFLQQRVIIHTQIRVKVLERRLRVLKKDFNKTEDGNKEFGTSMSKLKEKLEHEKKILAFQVETYIDRFESKGADSRIIVGSAAMNNKKNDELNQAGNEKHEVADWSAVKCKSGNQFINDEKGILMDDTKIFSEQFNCLGNTSGNISTLNIGSDAQSNLSNESLGDISTSPIKSSVLYFHNDESNQTEEGKKEVKTSILVLENTTE
mmetsp:Transcript_15723/g.23900  ORF Transcript_15723/g.23900 Transcript_15723/m.23900 type:complete len:232 (+) Transcript_15723:122-817(+)